MVRDSWRGQGLGVRSLTEVVSYEVNRLKVMRSGGGWSFNRLRVLKLVVREVVISVENVVEILEDCPISMLISTLSTFSNSNLYQMW